MQRSSYSTLSTYRPFFLLNFVKISEIETPVEKSHLCKRLIFYSHFLSLFSTSSLIPIPVLSLVLEVTSFAFCPTLCLCPTFYAQVTGTKDKPSFGVPKKKEKISIPSIKPLLTLHTLLILLTNLTLNLSRIQKPIASDHKKH